MIHQSIALRYSKALFDLDLSTNSCEKRINEFEHLLELIKQSPQFWKFLCAPQISLEEKEQILKKCLKNHFDPHFMNFLLYILEKNRIYFLPQIAIEYQKKVNTHLGLWEAKLVTTVPIKTETKEKLKNKLEAYYRKKIEFKEIISDTLIGGVFLEVSHQMIDWSIKGRIKNLKENLLTG